MLNQTGIVSPQSRDRGPRFNRREQPNALIEPFPLPSQFRSDGRHSGSFASVHTAAYPSSCLKNGVSSKFIPGAANLLKT